MQLNRWQIDKMIGQGGMATVWQGRDSVTGEVVALKFLGSDFCNEGGLRAQFLTEVKTIASIHHPNVIKIYDFGVLEQTIALSDAQIIPHGTPYYVMEYFSRGSLKDALPQLSWFELKQYLFAILDALATSHASGLIHRDLKPANILLGQRGPVVCDFGIAYNMHTEDGETEEGLTGTPSYMAPEQLRSQNHVLGPWTDLYAIGCLTYWLCTRRPPFLGSSLVELVTQHLRHEPRQLKPSFPVPEDFLQWVKACLRKLPFERPQFAADAIRTLRTLTEDKFTDPEFLTGKEVQPSEETLHLPIDLALPSSAMAHYDHDSTPWQMPPSWRRPTDELPTHATKLRGIGLVSITKAPFVGRFEQRDTLWKALLEANTDGLRFVILKGESGIGKTALINWFAHRVHLLGAAYPLHITHSTLANGHSGLAGLLRRELRAVHLTGSRLEERVQEYCDAHELSSEAHLLYSIIEPENTRDADALTQRTRFEVMARWITTLCRRRAHVLLVDDFQWQDELGEFMVHLAKLHQELPLLAVVSSRNDRHGEDSTLSQLVFTLIEHAKVTALSLTDLDEVLHTELARGHLPLTQDTTARLYALSKGHPLSLELALRDLCARKKFVETREGYRWDVESNISSERSQASRWLSGLGDLTQQLPHLVPCLEVATCLGQDFSHDEFVNSCTRLGFGRVEQHLNALVQAGYLNFDEFERGSFVHGQCREAINEQLDVDHAAHYHRAICEVLPNDTSVDAWRTAQHMIAGQMFAEAVARLRDAYDTAYQQDRFTLACEVLIGWAKCLKRLSMGCESPQWLSVKLKWADCLFQLGYPKFATRHVRSVMGRLTGSTHQRLKIEALLMWSLSTKWVVDESDANLSRIKQACDLAHDLGDESLLGKCAERHAVYLHTYGKLKEAREGFIFALERTKAVDDQHLRSLIYRGIARLCVDMDHLPEALAYARLSIESAKTLSSQSFQATIHLTVGDIYRRMGELDQANQHYTFAVKVFDHLGLPELWAAQANVGLLSYDRHQWQTALDWFEQARGTARKVQNQAAVLMLETSMLRGLAHLECWEEHDEILDRVLALENHQYAQKDSADVLRVLQIELEAMNQVKRAAVVLNLANLQFAALGL